MHFTARVQALRDRYPYQFARTFEYGLSIETGWITIIESACAQIDLALEEGNARKQNFSWLQIKEKLGSLRMYWDRGWSVPESLQPLAAEYLPEFDYEEGVSETEMDLVTQAIAKVVMVPEDVTLRIQKIIDAAEEQASITCQICGAPGNRKQLDGDGWVVVGCEKHGTRKAIVEFNRQFENERGSSEHS